ncbi:MAG: carboxymuconolactone decarboxylase family protein [Methanobacterium sp.]|nr:carboxymuconolactone decarboxylase family protein [Methanobacterium sp.]
MKVTEKQKNNGSELGRKLYSVRESYWISYNGIRTMKYMFRAKKNRELSSRFIERLMLTVTEVNGCAICSYAHSKRALESGMTSGEIQNMLRGIMDDVLLVNLQQSCSPSTTPTPVETPPPRHGNVLWKYMEWVGPGASWAQFVP